jgi:Cu(I)/Ag(I) efflux system membrane protein CusA/SilA
VKEKLAQLQNGLPAGVEIVTTYDRSLLIDRALANLTHKLLEEFLVVAMVCALFLWHWRSALVAIVALPLGVLVAFGNALPGDKCQHYVPWWHCHCCRGNGGRRHRYD